MPDSSKPHILLATSDDALAESLKDTGLRISRTRDGFDAIRLAVDSSLDAIVLDTTIYGLPRPDLALWLKLNPGTTDVPLIGLDADEEESGRQEDELDARVPRGEAIGRLAATIKELSELHLGWVEGDDLETRAFDPLSVCLDLAEIYRERLRVASAIFDIARIQHDLADIHYTTRSILDAAGRALDSELLALTLLRERSVYVLIRGGDVMKEQLDQLDFYMATRLTEHLGKEVELDKRWVFGRQHVLGRARGNPPLCRFFGHAITSGSETLGYLSGKYPSGETDLTRCAGLLPDLAAQIALLLVNADLIRAQEQHSEEFTATLRAILETSSISPLSEISSKSFLLHLLLIALDLCKTDRGCAVILDEETGEPAETAAIGCHESEVLSAPMREWPTVEEGIRHLAADQAVTDEMPNFRGRGGRLVVPLSAGDKVMGGLIALRLPATLSPRIIEAVKILAGLGGYFAYNRILHEQSIRSSIIEGQLKMAREIQCQMTPKTHPAIPGYDIFGRSEAAREVGGDFFDYLPGKDQRLTVAVADVSGKSIPASLLMTMSRAMVIAAIEQSHRPDQVLTNVNLHLIRLITEGRFVTACLVTIDGHKVSCASAGHQPLLIYRAATDSFEEIEPDGIAMGIVDNVKFERLTFRLQPGDIVLMYTDGLNEAMNSDHVQFGYDNIQKTIRQHAAGSAEEIVEALFTSIQEHAGGEDQSDDTTIVAIKRVADEEIDNANDNHKEK